MTALEKCSCAVDYIGGEVGDVERHIGNLTLCYISQSEASRGKFIGMLRTSAGINTAAVFSLQSLQEKKISNSVRFVNLYSCMEIQVPHKRCCHLRQESHSSGCCLLRKSVLHGKDIVMCEAQWMNSGDF